MNDPQCIASTLEKIKVMQAFCDGKTIECCDQSISYATYDRSSYPAWNWSNFDYRAKPTPKLRAWKAEEVPLGAWMRRIDKPEPIWIITHTENEFVRPDWLVNYEHSLDQGKTWRVCGKEVV